MDELIRKLKEAPLRAPSKNLDESVATRLKTQVDRLPSEGRRVGIGWAVAASLLMGVAGFLGGAAWGDDSGSRPIESPATSRIQVVVDSFDPFDFSTPAKADPTWTTLIFLEDKGESK